jgi:mandelate racemase
MKIASFRVRCVNVPMREPHRTASGVIAASPVVLLSVDTDEGVNGSGVEFDEDDRMLA